MAGLGLDSPILEAINANLPTVRTFQEIFTFYIQLGFSLIDRNEDIYATHFYFQLSQFHVVNAYLSISKKRKYLSTYVRFEEARIAHTIEIESPNYTLTYTIGSQDLQDFESPEILMQLWKNRILSDLHRGSVIQRLHQ